LFAFHDGELISLPFRPASPGGGFTQIIGVSDPLAAFDGVSPLKRGRITFS